MQNEYSYSLLSLNPVVGAPIHPLAWRALNRGAAAADETDMVEDDTVVGGLVNDAAEGENWKGGGGGGGGEGWTMLPNAVYENGNNKKCKLF